MDDLYPFIAAAGFKETIRALFEGTELKLLVFVANF